MPGLNRKGPEGAGAMTGRRMGRCNPDNRGKTEEEILQNRETTTLNGNGFGMGEGLRRGLGMGRGRGIGKGRAARFQGNR